MPKKTIESELFQKRPVQQESLIMRKTKKKNSPKKKLIFADPRKKISGYIQT